MASTKTHINNGRNDGKHGNNGNSENKVFRNVANSKTGALVNGGSQTKTPVNIGTQWIDPMVYVLVTILSV